MPRSAFERLRGNRGFELAIPGLWCAGAPDALVRPCVAIVGTRSATAYGRRLAGVFARDLGGAGCCIVSGLALGIDGAAHAAALEHGTPTIGVLGGGHDVFFPARNRGLAERMVAAGGAVLSPYPPDHAPRPGQFLARNGVVAALADAVVVIEAPARSGAINTAQWAAGRIPVFAVPGDVDRRHAAGCHALIRDGAILARGPEDVLEVLGMLATPVPARKPPMPEDPLSQELFAQLADGERDMDALAAAAGADAPAVIASLVQLELLGAIECVGADRFARKR
ncbi:MAG: DNA-processing protein DprA [Vulcanimicrobiaceae bacterium]